MSRCTQKGEYGLQHLLDDWGLTLEEMLEQTLMDTVAPAICTVCGYTTETKPDQTQGWCEECNKNTVVSGLILADFI